MSADNWGNCPRCKEQHEQKVHEAAERLGQAYGKVTSVEYLKLAREVAVPGAPPSETLREDYEIGIYEGRFEVDYGASCSECGFSFTYKYSAPAQD